MNNIEDKKKYIIMVLVVSLLLLPTIYFKLFRPYRLKIANIETINHDYNLDLRYEDIEYIKFDKSLWDGQGASYITVSLDDINKYNYYISQFDLSSHSLDYKANYKIKEIMNLLSVNKEKQVNFDLVKQYHTAYRRPRNSFNLDEEKYYYLYVIYYVENNIGKIFLIDDVNAVYDNH